MSRLTSAKKHLSEILAAGWNPDPVARKRALAAANRRKARRDRYQDKKIERLRAEVAAIDAEIAVLKALAKRNRTKNRRSRRPSIDNAA